MNTQPAYSHRKFFRATAICMLFPLVALASAAPLTSKASAQNVALAGPVARIPAAISDDHEVKLEGTLHPLAQARFDSGAMEALKPLHGITMVFSRSPQQQADLNALNTAQENPSSALYHKWLTPEQFAARFGMAATDLEKASAWLEHQGFTIDRLSRSRDRIFFSGNAGQVNRAFATELHYYTVKGQKHFAPSRALSVPSSLAEVVLTIGNLDNFQPHPMHRFVRQEEPNFTSGTSGSHYVSPGDIATIYDINPSYQAGINGTGQSITILGQSYIYLSDIEHFQSASGLAIKDPEMVLVPGTGPDGIATPDNEAESDLDLEWSGSVAPGAEVFFVYTGDGDPGGVFDSLQYAVDNRISPIISLSYGSCEGVINSSGILQALEELAQQGVTQGQTLIASSGDDGASACFYDTDLSLAQRTALSVAYPASSAFFTAVGGTMFNEGSGSYWQSTPGTDIISSATSYIPEIAWNEDYVYEGIGYLGSTTGGASILFAKPSWQTGIPGIPADNARDVPDVALDSAGGHDGLLFCSSDTSFWPQGQQSSCTNGFRDSTTGVLTEAGGTSFAAPIFAGMMALLNQKENSAGQGLLGPQLYTLASNASIYASAFHDITGGDNKCDTGESTACPNGPIGFSAGAGYDQTTGLGSVDLTNLLAAWGSSSLAESTINVVPSSTTVSQGGAVQFAITVTAAAGSGTPTGTVALLLDGSVITPDLTLTAGATNYSTTFTGNGTHVLVSTYSGDTSFGPSSKTVTLNALTGTIVEISATTTKPLLGAADTFSISVQPTAGLNHPDGSITILVDGTTVASNITLTPLAEMNYTTAFNTAGAHTISVQYSGSATYSDASGSLTIHAVSPVVPTTTSVTPANATPDVSQSDSFTVSVAPATGPALPSGTLAVTVDGTPLVPAPVLTNGAASFSTSFATAGSHAVNVSYPGGSGFSTSSASTTIVVPQEAIALSASNLTVNNGSSATSTITVTSTNGYTGTVAFTASSSTPAMANACLSTISNATVSGGGAATSTLTLSTGQATCPAGVQVAGAASIGSLRKESRHDKRRSEEAASAFAALLLLGFAGRRSRKLRVLVPLLAFVTLGTLLSGCGGSSTPKTPTASGSYSITITGHDTVTSTITSSTTLTVLVN